MIKRTALALLFLILCSFTAKAEEEEYPGSMTEAEKQQMLSEMYEDIEADEEFSPESAEGTDDSLPDEEIRKNIEKMLPDDSDLERFSETAPDRVMELAEYSCSYDSSRKLYRYLFREGKGFFISLPLGGFTDKSVGLIPDEGVQILAVEKDGEMITDRANPDGSFLFREKGNYSFIAGSTGKSALGTVSGSFRIIDVTESIADSFIWSPEGYKLKEIYLDKSPRKIDNATFVNLKEDGLYELVYKGAGTSGQLPEFRMMFKRDTTPPVIRWDGEVSDGMFSGEVSYEASESDATVNIWYNGRRALSDTHVLAAAGNYYVTATDRAGNMSTYSFVIVRRGRIPVKIVLCVLAALALLAAVTVLTGKLLIRVK